MRRFVYSAGVPVLAYLLLTGWFKLFVPFLDVPTPWGIAAMIIAIPFGFGIALGIVFLTSASSVKHFSGSAWNVAAALAVPAAGLYATLWIWDSPPADWEHLIRVFLTLLLIALISTLGTATTGVAGIVWISMTPMRGTCARCGYDLRMLTEPRCPECGEPFDTSLLDLNFEGDETRGAKKPDDAGEKKK